jgi:hypothetical protein
LLNNGELLETMMVGMTVRTDWVKRVDWGVGGARKQMVMLAQLRDWFPKYYIFIGIAAGIPVDDVEAYQQYHSLFAHELIFDLPRAVLIQVSQAFVHYLPFHSNRVAFEASRRPGHKKGEVDHDWEGAIAFNDMAVRKGAVEDIVEETVEEGEEDDGLFDMEEEYWRFVEDG